MGNRTNTRRERKQRAEFRTECEEGNAPCWICGLEIDYTARRDDWSNDDRFQEDRCWPLSTHAHLQYDPDNKRPSHAGRNRERGNGALIVDIGVLSRQRA